MEEGLECSIQEGEHYEYHIPCGPAYIDIDPTTHPDKHPELLGHVIIRYLKYAESYGASLSYFKDGEDLRNWIRELKSSGPPWREDTGLASSWGERAIDKCLECPCADWNNFAQVINASLRE